MHTLQTELHRLAAVFGTVLLPPIHDDDRYELPESLAASVYGLGCTCWMQDMTVLNPSNGFTFGECECTARSTNEQSGSFVSIQDIRASVVQEMGVRGMTPSEYEAWFDASEQAEYASTPAYRSSGAPALDLGYTEMEDEDYDAYMQEVA
jgi:hypothetical protein